MENKTLKLMELMITLSIFIPVVVGVFFRNYEPTKEQFITLRYFFLVGFYIISYVIIYKKGLDNKPIRFFILTNLFLFGIMIIYLSLVPDLVKLGPATQLILNFLFTCLGFQTIIVLPFLIVLWAVFGKSEDKK